MMFTVTPFRLNKGAAGRLSPVNVSAQTLLCFSRIDYSSGPCNFPRGTLLGFPTLTTVPAFQSHTHNSNTPVLSEDGH
jgi:hypothetical protein